MKDTETKAFPIVDQERIDTGMDLRDYFAAKAMQGFCSRQDLSSDDFSDMVEQSYQIADAMMEARK